MTNDFYFCISILFCFFLSILDLWILGENGDLSRWKRSIEEQKHYNSSSFSFSWRQWCDFRSRRSNGGGSQEKTIEYYILQDLLDLHRRFEEEKKRLGFESASSATNPTTTATAKYSLQSKRLFYLFQRDLIPGIAGEILENKEHRDHPEDGQEAVSSWKKGVAWTWIGLLNTGMLFYVFLFAVSQDSHRQSAWGLSFAVYLVVEIVLISTCMVILMHILVPAMIMKDVVKIKSRLLESIVSYYQRIHQEEEEEEAEKDQIDAVTEEEGREGDQAIDVRPASSTARKMAVTATRGDKEDKEEAGRFNAARYLFLSYRLAEVAPRDLPAAQIILKFSTPWPRQSYQHVADVKDNYDNRFTAVTRALSIVLIYLFTSLLSIPIAIQDMVLHLVMVTTIGYTILLHLQLYGVFPALVIIPSLGLCVLGYGIYRWWIRREQRQRAQLLAPITQITEEKKKKKKKKKELQRRRENGLPPLSSSAVVSNQGEKKKQQRMTRRESLQYGLQLSRAIKQTIESNENVEESWKKGNEAKNQEEVELSVNVSEEDNEAKAEEEEVEEGDWSLSDLSEPLFEGDDHRSFQIRDEEEVDEMIASRRPSGPTEEDIYVIEVIYPNDWGNLGSNPSPNAPIVPRRVEIWLEEDYDRESGKEEDEVFDIV